MKPSFLPLDEPNLYNNYLLRDLEYIDRSCINFPCHCVLNQFDLNTDLVDNVILTKVAIPPTKKPRSVSPHKSKSKSKESASKKKLRLKTRNIGARIHD